MLAIVVITVDWNHQVISIRKSGSETMESKQVQKYIKFTQRQALRERGLNSVMEISSSHLWNNGLE